MDTRAAQTSPVDFDFIDLLRADGATRAETFDELLRLELEGLPAVTNGERDIAAQRIRGYLQDATDPNRYPVFNGVARARSGGETIAFIHSFVEARALGSKMVDVVHAFVLTRPEARGRTIQARLFRPIFCRYLRAHPFRFRPRYYYGYCINPISYAFTCKRTVHVYPGHADAPTELRALYRLMVGEEVTTIREPVTAHLSARDEARLRASTSPHISYFLKVNPGFRNGDVLPFVARVNNSDTFVALLREIGRRTRRLPARYGRRIAKAS